MNWLPKCSQCQNLVFNLSYILFIAFSYKANVKGMRHDNTDGKKIESLNLDYRGFNIGVDIF